MSVPAIQSQSADAPTQWLAQHGDVLFRFALGRVRSRDAAEELVQDTLLAGLRSFATFDHRSAVQTWLVGILKHKIIDYVAARCRQPEQLGTQSEDDFFNGRGKWKNPPQAGELHPGLLLEQAELRAILNECMDKLPRRLAEVFMLHQINETSTDEICKESGITPTNLWSILYRARLRLRECLSKNWFDPETKGKKKQRSR